MNKFTAIELQQSHQSIFNYLQKHWKIFLAEGVFFVILGTLAIIVPHIFTTAITVFLGWLLLMGGIVQIIRAASIFNMPGFSLWIIIGILQLIIGYFLVTEPTQGSLTLTMLLTVFFAMEGFTKIYLAFVMRPVANWSWVFFSGITALFLAMLVWVGWPDTGTWVLGLLVGINMVFLGWSLIKISLHHKTF
ncbi:MAG: HdeD family acid-resistance protein [Methylovulum sp.]